MDQAQVEQALLAVTEVKARELCESVKRASDAGVPDSLLQPRLMEVFREAGMLPDLDFGTILGMLR